jgi:hypothetical protein
MKRHTPCAAALIMSLAACDTMNQPMTSGSFDPLRPPGSGDSQLAVAGPGFTAGQFVSTVMNNTAFFNKRPKGDADADKLLARGTSMKVISSDDSYARVELDSGEIGWVPVVMIEDPKAAASAVDAAGATGAFDAASPNEIQVYPPLDGIPSTGPSDLPPGGAIPTVIDPEAAASAPLPDIAPPPPVPESTEPAPLPDIAAPPAAPETRKPAPLPDIAPPPPEKEEEAE